MKIQTQNFLYLPTLLSVWIIYYCIYLPLSCKPKDMRGLWTLQHPHCQNEKQYQQHGAHMLYHPIERLHESAVKVSCCHACSPTSCRITNEQQILVP